MRVRVNLKSDPISLVIIAATGHEHFLLERVGHDSITDVAIPEGDSTPEMPNPPPGPFTNTPATTAASEALKTDPAAPAAPPETPSP